MEKRKVSIRICVPNIEKNLFTGIIKESIIPTGELNTVTGVTKKSTMCLGWYNTTTVDGWEIIMNEVTPIELEAITTFGYIYIAFLNLDL